MGDWGANGGGGGGREGATQQLQMIICQDQVIQDDEDCVSRVLERLEAPHQRGMKGIEILPLSGLSYAGLQGQGYHKHSLPPLSHPLLLRTYPHQKACTLPNPPNHHQILHQ